MKRNASKLSKVLLGSSAAGVLGAVVLLAPPAEAQWVPPPPAYIATTEPVYYEGHAAYWYGNHWYWHDEHGAWQHYDHEPAFLADRRAHWGTTGQTRWSYGHGRPYHR